MQGLCSAAMGGGEQELLPFLSLRSETTPTCRLAVSSVGRRPTSSITVQGESSPTNRLLGSSSASPKQRTPPPSRSSTLSRSSINTHSILHPDPRTPTLLTLPLLSSTTLSQRRDLPPEHLDLPAQFLPTSTHHLRHHPAQFLPHPSRDERIQRTLGSEKDEEEERGERVRGVPEGG